MIDRVKGAIAEFPVTSVNVDIAGFFWMQGESDAYNLASVDQQIPGTFAVETIDLSQHPDNIHFDSPGLMALGDRFADEWLSIPEPSPLAFLGLSLVIFPFLRPKHQDKA